MKAKLILLSLIVCCIFSAAVQGQEKGFSGIRGFREQDNIFTLSGNGVSDDSLDNSSFGAELSLGHFFSDNLAGELRQGINLIDLTGNDDGWSASTRGALDLYFGNNTICPFVGVNLGYVYGDLVADTFVAGPEGGLKLFVNDTTYISGLIEYQFFFDKGDKVGDIFTDGRFVYSIGIGFKF
jgi:hypothetical protein